MEPACLNGLAQTALFFLQSSSYIRPHTETDTCMPSVPKGLQLHNSSSRRREPDGVMFSFFLGIHRMGNVCAGSNNIHDLVTMKWRKIPISQLTHPGMEAGLEWDQISHLPDQCPFHCTVLLSIIQWTIKPESRHLLPPFLRESQSHCI